MPRVLHTHQPTEAPTTETGLPASAPTTLVVDGNYLLKCSFHATATNPAYVVNGRHIGAVYEALRKLRWLVTQLKVTKCVVFWDGEHGGKLRHNLYPYYKANRKNKQWYRGASRTEAQAQEDSRSQRSIEAQKVRLQGYLEELFVRQTEQPMMESDDLIAYYCQQYHQRERIIIFTNDRDLCQLLGLSGVSVYLDNLKIQLNRDNFRVEFPYHYANAALVKILCGDASDNIKGVKGLGQKTLLDEFPDMVTRPLTLQEVKQQALVHCEGRKNTKKKPLAALENLLEGVSLRPRPGSGEDEAHAFGDALYELNQQLVDLACPMLTREARQEVVHVGELVLNPSERGSRFLLPMLHEDSLLRFYHGDLRHFCEPFFPLIARERQLFTENQVVIS